MEKLDGEALLNALQVAITREDRYRDNLKREEMTYEEWSDLFWDSVHRQTSLMSERQRMQMTLIFEDMQSSVDKMKKALEGAYLQYKLQKGE